MPNMTNAKVLAQDAFTKLLRLVTDTFNPAYGIEHHQFESPELLLPQGSAPITMYTPWDASCFCTSGGMTLLVVHNGSKEGLIRYDYFTTTDPKGLYMHEVIDIINFLRTTLPHLASAK